MTPAQLAMHKYKYKYCSEYRAECDGETYAEPEPTLQDLRDMHDENNADYEREIRND